MKIIELSNITFYYDGEQVPVFDNFDFSVEKGMTIAIDGENGAGKTTLFRILNGLSFPQQGKYLFDGREITAKYLKNNHNAKLFHKQIGFLFQNPEVMLFNSTVYEEIAFGPRQMGFSEEEVKKRTYDCMEIFGLKDLAGKAPYHLSGGQKKKVALAAVMSLNPEVVILDEPFDGLDNKSRESLLNFLSELKEAGKNILISTHEHDLIEKIVDEKVTIISTLSKYAKLITKKKHS